MTSAPTSGVDLKSGNRIDFRTIKHSTPPGSIGAAIAESDLGTDPLIQAALKSAIDAAFLTYLPVELARQAEAACADFYAERFGWTFPADWVRLVPDVVAGLGLVLARFTSPGDTVVVPTPCYPPFLEAARRAGRRVVTVPALDAGDRWGLDLDGIGAALGGGGLLILCNPHNPLGHVATATELLAIADVVERAGARVFADEIHAPIVYGGAHHIPYASLSPATGRHTVTAIATSKGWNIPGLKAAQLILSSPDIRAIWDGEDLVPTQSGSILGAVATTVAYRDGGAWLDDFVCRLQGKRDLLGELVADKLPGVRYRRPEGTYLAWLDFSAYRLPTSPAVLLSGRALVETVAGESCGPGGGDAVRFNFAMSDDDLESAVTRIASVVEGG
jgi:cystathionine beta-lyase